MSVDPKQYTSLLQAVIHRLNEAGRIFMKGYRNPGEARRKGRVDLVTDTDLAVERFLAERLPPLTPGAVLLAEESAESAAVPDRCWIIDPVDGTTNFVHGWPLTGICIAYCEAGEPVVGVVSLPVLGECYYASKDGGAYRNGIPLRVAEADRLENAMVSTGFPYDAAERLDELLPAFGAVQARAQGLRITGSSAVDLAWLADGRLDAYFETGVMPWDVAAGVCVLREAGGVAARYDGSPFTLEDRRILAANGALLPELVEVLAPWA